MKKRLLSCLLTLVMLLGLLPTAAFAAEPGNTTDQSVVSVNQNGVDITKQVTPNQDGTYKITMDAYVTGQKVITTPTPMDIVLVLDVSGSMEEALSSTVTSTYVATWKNNNGISDDINRNRGEYYYSTDEVNYYRITAVSSKWNRDRYVYTYTYQNGSETGTFTADRMYNTPQNVYVKQDATTNISKMEALKEAVKSFIDATAEKNAAITDESKQNRISIVKFACTEVTTIGNGFTTSGHDGHNSQPCNNSQIVVGLTGVNASSKETLKTQVDALSPAGATAAERGLNRAFAALGNSTSDRNKVVIFFTDGEPNHSSGFNNTVATDAVNTAKKLKESGATIYTIGMFKDANPNDTQGDFNKYLHAVSSNYPNATASSNFNVTFGDGGNNSYYKAATSSASINGIFEDISESITPAVQAGAESVLTDTVGAKFDLVAENATGITIQESSASGSGEEPEWSTPETVDSSVTASVDAATGKVSVTGFDYSANYVHQDNGQWTGKKLIISFDIKPDLTANWSAGTNTEDTNAATSAGLKAAADGEFITVLGNSPKVDITAYTVKYTDGVADAEIFADQESVVPAGQSTPSAPTGFTRTGYTFKGWNPTTATTVTDNVTYTATWEANEAKIIFEENGGSAVADMTGTTDTVISDTAMPTTTKQGYTFDGWYADAEFTGEKVTALPTAYPAGTTTYYAKWTEKLVPGLTVTKTLPTGAPTVVAVGDTITWNIKVDNTGDTDLTGIKLTDSIPGAKLYDGDGKELDTDYTFALAKQEAKDFTAKYTTTAEDAGKTISNVATAEASDGTKDESDPDETGTVTVKVRVTFDANGGAWDENAGVGDYNLAPDKKTAYIDLEPTGVVPQIPTDPERGNEYKFTGWYVTVTVDGKEQEEQVNFLPTTGFPKASQLKAYNYTVHAGWEPIDPNPVVNYSVYQHFMANKDEEVVTIEINGSAAPAGTKIVQLIAGKDQDQTYEDQNYAYIEDETKLNDVPLQNDAVLNANDRIDLYYYLDNWDDKDDKPTGGDGIPDCYQALIKFDVSGDGTVDPKYQVETLKDEWGTYVESKEVTASSKASAGADSEFMYWADSDGEVTKDEQLSVELNVAAGQSYTYTAYFKGIPAPTEDDVIDAFNNEGEIKVWCTSKQKEHFQEIYRKLEKGDFEITQVNGDTVTVTVYLSSFLADYNNKYRDKHEADEADFATFELKWNGSAWVLAQDELSLDFPVKCDATEKPTEQEVKDAFKEGNGDIKLYCTTKPDDHKVERYTELKDGFTIGSVKSDYSVTITVDVSPYLADYNDTYAGTKHEADGVSKRTFEIRLEGETWVLVQESISLEFPVKCEPEVVSDTYTVTFKEGRHGTLRGETEFEVEAGETVSSVPTVKADSGYEFTGWLGSDGKTYSTSEIRDLKINSKMTFTAQYEEDDDNEPTTYTVQYYSNNKPSRGYPDTYEAGERVDVIKLPKNWSNDGYEFVCWNTAKDGSGTWYMPSDRLTNSINRDYVLYAIWVREDDNDDSTGVGKWLNTDDHIQYLYGYPDNTFGPTRNMTRAEAAQMFFNLLRDQDVWKTVSFTDVDGTEWFADAVHTMASLGVLKGYPNGSFQPNKPITRAEFTTMAMQFTNLDQGGSNSFSDVSMADWFYTFVVGASKYGWISGYPDGTFKPNANITRAEVTSIVNNMLGRYADEDYVDDHPNRINSFIDLSDSYWAYYPIMEATNEHDYSKGYQSEDWSNVSHR